MAFVATDLMAAEVGQGTTVVLLMSHSYGVVAADQAMHTMGGQKVSDSTLKIHQPVPNLLVAVGGAVRFGGPKGTLHYDLNSSVPATSKRLDWRKPETAFRDLCNFVQNEVRLMETRPIPPQVAGEPDLVVGLYFVYWDGSRVHGGRARLSGSRFERAGTPHAKFTLAEQRYQPPLDRDLVWMCVHTSTDKARTQVTAALEGGLVIQDRYPSLRFFGLAARTQKLTGMTREQLETAANEAVLFSADIDPDIGRNVTIRTVGPAR